MNEKSACWKGKEICSKDSITVEILLFIHLD